ncbi:MAG: transcriptional regulator [Oceanospirillaceae bacterium]|nr:transcriptional regulator [Oceanospirillaceae bacterium]
MGLLSSIKALFLRSSDQGSDSKSAAGKGSKSSQHHEHKGFSIETHPLKEGGSYRVQGWIRNEGKEHHFIRADQSNSLEAGHELSLFKARQCIDQLGDKLFKTH